MSKTASVVGLAIMALSIAGIFFQAVDDQPAPTPDVPDVVLPEGLAEELAAVPAAKQWAGLLEGLGRYIAADGESNAPELKTMSDIESLRNAALRAPLDALDGGEKIGELLAPHLAALGVGLLDEDNRREQCAELFIGAGQAMR